MLRRKPRVRRQDPTSGERRGFIKASDLSATELKAVVALHNHGKVAPVSDGIAYTRELFIRWTTFLRLIELGLAYRAEGDVGIGLTNKGHGMGRSFKDRPILGYD